MAIVSIGILLYKIYKSNYLTDNLYLIIIIIVFGTAIAHACSMNDRALVDEDRSHYELDARYFLEDKNSWEIDDYSDEKYGSSLTDDHGPLWVVFLADTYIVANSFNIDNPIRCTNYAILWVYLCFYLLLFIIGTYVGSTYRTGIMALVFFNIYVYSVYEITGSRDAYRLVGLLLLLIYVINQIDNVSDGDAKWFEYLMLGLFCYLSMNGHEGNVYIMLGMFIVVSLILVIQQTPIKHFIAFISVVFVGTVLGITKTIKIYIRTGSLKSSTNIPFHDTPVIEQIASINIKRSDLQTIWMSYTLQVKWMILLGLIGLIMMIVVSFKKKDRIIFRFAIIICGMLLPMTGIMNWIGYEVSLWFLEQKRYRMYFLMLLAITGSWIVTRNVKDRIYAIFSIVLCFFGFVFFLNAEAERCTIYDKVQLDSCTKARYNYEKVADIVASLTDKDVFTQDQRLLYYLQGNPRLLFHPYSEDLIQAKTDKEIEAALEKLNVGAILLPPDGLEYHDYSLLPFWNYINTSDNFSQYNLNNDGEFVSNKVIFYRIE